MLLVEIENKLKTGVKTAITNSPKLDINLEREVEIEKPNDESHGDYATNIAMILAGQAGMPPRKIAEAIVGDFPELDIVSQLEVAGPGFINFKLTNHWLNDVLLEILEQGSDYGASNVGAGEKVQVEFVSTNPTGPLHVGHGRGAAVGDVLASILTKAGFKVEREYYINNAGQQMEILGRSVAIRYQQLFDIEIELPEQSYVGDYITDIAQKIKDKSADKYLAEAKAEEYDYFKEFAYQEIISKIRADLNEFGIEFDNWFSEQDLHPEKIEAVIAELKEQNYIYQKEGALWFESRQFDDDKDRVVIKEDGNPTYLAADIAYHKDKFERGFEQLINVWGADHHGYVARMKAAVEALGKEASDLDVVLVQIVNLLRDGKQIAMSKRAGEFITLKDVIDEVGKDAARYFYIMRSTDTHLDFDLELAKKESTDNPVYYVQYAHARICSILAEVEKEEVKFKSIDEIDLSYLEVDEEIALIKKLAAFPLEIAKSAQSKAPHHITRYADQLANLFHKFYNKCHVLIDNQELMQARLQLVRATKIVLVNLFEILGVNAPESM